MRRFMTLCLLTAFLANGAPAWAAKGGRGEGPKLNSVQKRIAKAERIAGERDGRADKLKAKALQRARRRPIRPVGTPGVMFNDRGRTSSPTENTQQQLATASESR